MGDSFFFYDLETTGFNPRTARVVQFAGQRTDSNLQVIDEPVNELIRLTPDILPEPDAVLLTGITPQQTLQDGLTETDFLKLFYEQVAQPNSTYLGFNSVRFDDEFMRFMHYRNFYDAYEWQWKNGCSRWDVLDLVRMTRALRPDGITWPFASDGKPSNRLELLTSVNKLSHSNAHDALSDVQATIAVAQLVKQKQPELFEYLFAMRDKKKVAELVNNEQPFVYTSGRYSGEFWHTTVAVQLARHPGQDASLVYDLRFDPKPFLDMDVAELIQAWKYTKDPSVLRLPVKTLKYNRCPAIAPLGVIRSVDAQQRIGLNLKKIAEHLVTLEAHKQDFVTRLQKAVKQMDQDREQKQIDLVANEFTVDEQLYDGFIDGRDKSTMLAIRDSDPEELSRFAPTLQDKRLQNLLPLYKARNYPRSLTEEENRHWLQYCSRKLLTGGEASSLARYYQRIEELSGQKPAKAKQFLLEELRLYGESIMPTEVGDYGAD